MIKRLTKESLKDNNNNNMDKFPEKFKYENINKRLYKPFKEDIENEKEGTVKNFV